MHYLVTTPVLTAKMIFWETITPRQTRDPFNVRKETHQLVDHRVRPAEGRVGKGNVWEGRENGLPLEPRSRTIKQGAESHGDGDVGCGCQRIHRYRKRL